jgi:hypothetical protein
MLDKDAQGAADRFIAKLTDKNFTVSRSQNNEDDYDTEKQERDSNAVVEFSRTETFQDIMKLQ